VDSFKQKPFRNGRAFVFGTLIAMAKDGRRAGRTEAVVFLASFR